MVWVNSQSDQATPFLLRFLPVEKNPPYKRWKISPCNNKVHQLIDAVTSSPEIFKELPVSYYTRNIPRRYDYIYKSDKWTTKNLIFDYDNSKSASSDHAILVGDFEERQ